MASAVLSLASAVLSLAGAVVFDPLSAGRAVSPSPGHRHATGIEVDQTRPTSRAHTGRVDAIDLPHIWGTTASAATRAYGPGSNGSQGPPIDADEGADVPARARGRVSQPHAIADAHRPWRSEGRPRGHLALPSPYARGCSQHVPYLGQLGSARAHVPAVKDTRRAPCWLLNRPGGDAPHAGIVCLGVRAEAESHHAGHGVPRGGMPRPTTSGMLWPRSLLDATTSRKLRDLDE